MQLVATKGAPAAIGPYSQGIKFSNLIFTAGQIALDPESMTVVPGEVAEQTDRVFRNLSAILNEAGSSLQQVIKTTVYLVDMNDFAAMNEVYARYFGDHRPARSTVAVQGLPKGVRVEIEAIAALAE